MNRNMRAGMLIAALAGTSLALQASTFVYANNPAPGDTFTNAGSSNQGQAVTATGWFYNNVRNSGSVGINTTLPRTGNGSAYFTSPGGSGKADIEYLSGGIDLGGNFLATSSLGAFSAFNAMSYEWYRDSASTVDGNLHPVMRILLDADGDLNTTGDRGGLVFERVYNSLPISTDTWVSDSIGATTFLWNFGLGIGFAANINGTAYAYDATLAEWKAYFPNAVILGFSHGVGSGWNGVFKGAVDNSSWQIGTVPASAFNFEVRDDQGAVPEPSTWGLMAIGLAGLMGVRRKRS